MTDLDDLHLALRARPTGSPHRGVTGGFVNLAGYDPSDTSLGPTRKKSGKELADLGHDLFDRHELLYAGAQRSVLLVLQGLDCSGKNGTIKHVVITMNPAGVRVGSFVVPTAEEESHHFLWRYRRWLPDPGQLGVFNRSYYEDVVVPLVSGDESEEVIDGRLAEINEFEAELHAAGTVVVKCFLHISYDEQRNRFLRRLRRDDKRWKFDEADIETRSQWNEFQSAYGTVIARTTTDHAPWLIIPADAKWHRNWLIAHLLRSTFDAMNLDYPKPDLDLERLRGLLEPPN